MRIVAYGIDDGPVLYYSYHRASRQATFTVQPTRPALENQPLVPIRPIAFPARDGLMLAWLCDGSFWRSGEKSSHCFAGAWRSLGARSLGI